MLIETTSEYIARKGIAPGELIVGDPPAAAVIETQLEYMARKGLQPGDEIVSDPAESGLVVYETQLEYMARKAAEAEVLPAPADSARKGKASE